MSEPTREQIETLAATLYEQTEWSGCAGSAWRHMPTTFREQWRSTAVKLLAVGVCVPERLREVEAERDALAAKLAKAEHHRELAREARAAWERLYREASGLPDSEHMARRMEDIARKAEQAAAERDEARARVRELEGGS